MYRALFDALSRWFLVLARILLVAMLALIMTEIILRNLFLSSTRISDEYSGYLACWLTLLGYLHAARSDSFIRVNVLWTRATGRGLDLLKLGAAACNLALSGVVCYATINLTVTSYQFHATSSQWSQTLLFVPQVIMPVSFGLLSILYVEEVVRQAAKLVRGGVDGEARRPA